MVFHSIEKFVKNDLINLMNKWEVTYDDIHQILNDIEHESIYSKDSEWIIVNNEPIKQYCKSGEMQEYQIIIKHPDVINDNQVMTICEKDKSKFYAYLQELKTRGFHYNAVVTHISWKKDELVLEFLRSVSKY